MSVVGAVKEAAFRGLGIFKNRLEQVVYLTLVELAYDTLEEAYLVVVEAYQEVAV